MTIRRTARFPVSLTLAIGVMCALAIVTARFGSAAQEPEAIDVHAPELVGGPWLNTANKQPIKLASRKGKVTVVEFWTFG